MKVAVFHGAGSPITIEDRDEPECGPRDVRIAIARCGICGSDVTLTSGTPFDYEAGRAIGHEFAGEVIEKGRDVSGLKVGDRIASLPVGACGDCTMCKAGHTLYCPNGTPLFGGFGERMVLPERAGFRLPESLSLADGALVEPMACGRKALRVAGFGEGQTLLVLGAGNMALSAIFWARRLGAGKIAIMTRSNKRDDIAMAFGADTALRLDDPDPQAITRVLGGPPDIVVEAIGKPDMLGLAIEKAGLGGSVVSLGMCSVPDPILPAFATFKEISLHFPLGYSIEDFAETVRAFEADDVRPDSMVSDTIALDELPEMIEEMRAPHSHLKVQVDPNAGCNHG